MVTILRSIVSTLSMQGRTKKSPGPLAFLDVIRPSLKMTARWYSLTICARERSKTTASKGSSCASGCRCQLATEVHLP